MATSDLTPQRLRELLHYDPETGVFTWRVAVGRKIKAGDVAGAHNADSGYWSIGIQYKKYRGHRLAWLYMHGVWPTHEVDHLDGDRSNNRINNLRDVPSTMNKQNRRRSVAGSNSGLLGAYPSSVGSWRSQIAVNGQSVHLGSFQDADAAHAAFVQAKRKAHDGNTL